MPPSFFLTLRTAKTHVITIWCGICLTNNYYYTRRQYFSIPSTKFTKFPQCVLLVSGLPVTLSRVIGFIRADVAPGSWLIAALPDRGKPCWTWWHKKLHVLFLQQTFSCSSGILLQTQQVHQVSGVFCSGWGDGLWKSSLPVNMFLANSRLLRPWLSSLIIDWSLSSEDSLVTNSYKKKRERQGLNKTITKPMCIIRRMRRVWNNLHTWSR